ncbi:hypothetical protein [Saccharopolyspora sp. 5N708]
MQSIVDDLLHRGGPNVLIRTPDLAISNAAPELRADWRFAAEEWRARG